MTLTQGEAAKLLSIDKSTISKAIKGGKLSATKKLDGSYDIDPAELFRWRDNDARHQVNKVDIQPYSPANSTTSTQDSTPNSTPEPVVGTSEIEALELRFKLASAEKEITGLKEQAGKEIAVLKERIEDLKSDKKYLQEEMKPLLLLATAKPQEEEKPKGLLTRILGGK